ncbi:hypothetical protein PFICI_10454 [Pestalotiopsis fici W106-1]|uniref:Uncharacterized protein n=1 Tax=Pestalotiopsis fici (strain W106-1 / CGMCC3.15140) TaxID=1229662 RepID=W3WZ47_PESFW|nr:uncharacterized protein PFICI_10454 [Pestalotiopsis fici W106-1]ETS78392.1 hypothetical protein PFICI_10454 [Pestalotiopsis fici W106-1]
MHRASANHPHPLGSHPVHPSSSTRRISASFSTDGPLSSLPTVSTSSLAVSTTNGELPMVYEAASRPSSKIIPTSIPLRKASTVTTYETAEGTRTQNFENLRPINTRIPLHHRDSLDIAAAKLRAKSDKPRPLATIPKSNTLSVITNLTASISRVSLSKFGRSASISSNAGSDQDRSFTSGNSFARASYDGEDEDPQAIHTAQSSAYWTGRFMALQDRFRNENLLPENMTTLINAHAERSMIPENRQQTSARLPASYSNPNLARYTGRSKLQRSSLNSQRRQQRAKGSLDATRLEDEDDRARRVFLHLEALCTTSEARKSLRAWQRIFARRRGKEGPLDRLLGRVDRDFTRRAKDSERSG